ncbi:MAG: PAS domain S-box protein [Candidatus Bathyarchaeia archaeon]
MSVHKKSVSNKHISESIVPQEFPIVGIGASAGGLEAFKVLLESLPVDTGLAFVIIQHLATSQESMLTDILSRFTGMVVLQVEDGMHVEPNHVYVIPPGSTMTLADGSLKLNPKGKSLRPIDAFLSSLATERKTQAIGIVLSGTGTDGTEGLKAVKAEGGITFAQDPESAQYSGMPYSAISAETVDFVLFPEKIAKELSRIAKHPQLVRSEIIPQEPKANKETGLRRIFTLLKSSFNVDFTHYKETVVNRRITRRMVINHVDNITKYAEYIGTHPAELQALFNDMLIGVTSFFREPDTFSILKEKLFPELLKNLASKEPVRIWIPGCSTGEEAYSFAIALQEFLEEIGKGDVRVQIFGTDVNEKNVDKARQGIYPKSIEADVSESRLKRFFTSFNGSYQIAKFIRDICVFAKQDLTADPPFSNLSLISCRNMLIYFDSQLQERIVSILHYALRPNGFLVLGESESIGKSTALFEPVFKRGSIYVKKVAEPRANFGFASAVPYSRKTVLKEHAKIDPVSLLRDEVDRLLITEYVPAALLVNSNLDILVFRGNVTTYLSPESGQASLNLAKLIRKELRSEVQTVVYRAKKENKPVKAEAIRFQYGDQQKTINIQVIPLRAVEYAEPFFLVLFEDVSSAAAHLRQTIELAATPEGREDVKNNQIRELKEELESSKQYLQTVIENQEATNEELRAAMEEVQSSNEELQSTNEELETAKEELQSSNEELTTLNDELKNRNQALARLNDNLANLNRNVDPAVVMVDGNLKIRLFTPSAQRILNLSPSDTGLPISNLRLGISIPDLEKTILAVIATLGAADKEVSDEKGRSYEMRVRPYITEDNRIDGAVLSFIDVDVLKKHEVELRGEKEKYRTLAENSPDIIARVDKDLRYLYINSAFEKTTGLPLKNFIGRTNQEIQLPRKFAETWTQILQNVFETGKEQKGEFEFPSREGVKFYQYAIVPEFSVNGNVETLLSMLKDVTERKKTEEALAESEQKYRTIVETAAEGIVIAKTDGTHIFVNNRLAQMFGYSTDELLRKSSFELLSEEEQRRQASQMRKDLEKGQVQYREFEFSRKDGSILWAACNASPLFDETGKHVANISLFSDITERKKTEEALRKSEAEYSSLFANMIDGFAYCQMIFDDAGKPVDWVYLQVNDAFQRITGLPRDALIGKKVTQAVHGIKEENPELFEIYGRVALTGQKEKLEYFLKPLNLWLKVSVYCPAKGYFAAVLEDITERKKMEQEVSDSLEESQLRQSEISALLKGSRAVLQHKEFPDSARAIFDACKEVIGATAGYVALLSDDGKENEVLFLDSGGLPCTVDPSLPMPIRGLRGEVYNSGKVAIENDFPQSEWQKFSPKGHVVLENVMFAPLTIEQRTVGVIGLANKHGGFTKRDAEMAAAFGEIASVALANSKMLEMLEENGEQLKSYSEHLEALVEERTQKLRDSERLAAIGETAGMVGHDIRNPLQSITGELYLARTNIADLPDTHAKEDLKESIGYIEEQLLYVNKIVQDLQDYAKAPKPQLQETDLEKTVHDVLSTVNIPDDITVSTTIQAGFPKICTDPLYLKRVLTNLTSNAVQAMPKGGKIAITATRKDKKIFITVADTGEGIPDDVKDKLFKPLFTTKAKGQGFGLAVVKKLTEALNGNVTVESELGKGTRFTVEFPLN